MQLLGTNQLILNWLGLALLSTNLCRSFVSRPLEAGLATGHWSCWAILYTQNTLQWRLFSFKTRACTNHTRVYNTHRMVTMILKTMPATEDFGFTRRAEPSAQHNQTRSLDKLSIETLEKGSVADARLRWLVTSVPSPANHKSPNLPLRGRIIKDVYGKCQSRRKERYIYSSTSLCPNT